MGYGFRIFKVRFTPVRKMTPDLQFNNPHFGQAGAYGAISAACSALVSGGGDADQKKGSYFRLRDARKSMNLIVLEGSGGMFGTARDVVDITTDAFKPAIVATDAVLERMKMLLVIPDSGDSGLLVSETKGRSHLTSSLIRTLNTRLRPLGVQMRLDSDFTDAEAWNNFLDGTSIDVKALELVQTHKPSQGVQFGDKSVARAVISLQLAPGAQAKSKLLKELRKAFKKGAKPKLTGLLGLKAAGDDDFDEQRVVYVENGRRRSIKVAADWPAFIYDLGDIPPSTQDLLDGCRSEVQHLLAEQQINLPQGWWPRATDLKTI